MPPTTKIRGQEQSVWYKEQHGDTLDTEVTFYKTFLIVTDYIPSKMMEAQLAGETINEDYSAVLQYRKEAREKINALESGILSGSSSDANLSG